MTESAPRPRDGGVEGIGKGPRHHSQGPFRRFVASEPERVRQLGHNLGEPPPPGEQIIHGDRTVAFRKAFPVGIGDQPDVCVARWLATQQGCEPGLARCRTEKIGAPSPRTSTKSSTTPVTVPAKRSVTVNRAPSARIRIAAGRCSLRRLFSTVESRAQVPGYGR